MNKCFQKKQVDLPVRVLIFFLALAPGQPSSSQQPPPTKPATAAIGGSATAGEHTPIRDAKSRVITAGGFVDGAPIIFEDVSHQAGLQKIRQRSGSPDKKFILEAPASGVAIIDYDNDGWPVI